jgi:hypothetical protein
MNKANIQYIEKIMLRWLKRDYDSSYQVAEQIAEYVTIHDLTRRT